MITAFFDYVRSGHIKVRIMFRHMDDLPSNPDIQRNSDEKYFKLYYQFIKNAFGFAYADFHEPTIIRIYLDQLPDKKEKCAKFKQFLWEMQKTNNYRNANVIINKEDIAEVCSHDHVILQCVDVILGAMFFRLNELNKVIPEGARKRGKRTIAKEKLYKHINAEICSIFPRFNIGVSTGWRGQENPTWEAPYTHWRFRPN